MIVGVLHEISPASGGPRRRGVGLETVWQSGAKPERPRITMHREEFYERVRTDAMLASSGEAEWLTLAVSGALKVRLAPGAARDVLAQPPKDLKAFWVEAV